VWGVELEGLYAQRQLIGYGNLVGPVGARCHHGLHNFSTPFMTRYGRDHDSCPFSITPFTTTETPSFGFGGIDG
ncbi:hypothetical protein, partial [Pseudoxanthomonas japonensis]|uniref:hypothetical protein n=1 Tax=Pseudoxanthomonas japonensis TaxID=69284 RepID=UPI001EE4DFEF